MLNPNDGGAGLFEDTQAVTIPKAGAIVAANLRRRIVHGELDAGDALPTEGELMELYEVSRPTLREALRILESESLITVRRGARGGARVAFPDASVTARHAALLLSLKGTTLRDVFDARAVIEPTAAEMLARRGPKSDLSRLRDLHDIEQATEDHQQFATAAANFHQEVVELAGNNTLALLSNVLHTIVRSHHQATMVTSPSAAEARGDGLQAHANLIAAIEAGKAALARKTWEEHLEIARQVALDALGPRATVDLLDLVPNTSH